MVNEIAKPVKIRHGVYRLGDYEVWHESWTLWRIWHVHPEGKSIMLDGHRTLREAIAAVRSDR